MLKQVKTVHLKEALLFGKVESPKVPQGTAHLAMMGHAADRLLKAAPTDSKHAISESAALLSELGFKAEKSIAKSLEDDRKILQAQLALAEYQEMVWGRFNGDFKTYRKDENIENFRVVMKDLIKIYGPNSPQGKEAQHQLDKGNKAWKHEEHWNHESTWDRFKSGEWSDPDSWHDFRHHEKSKIEDLAGFAAKTPDEFALYSDTVEKMIHNRITDLGLQLEFVEILQMILSGKGNPVVQAQALIQVVIQLGLSVTTESTQRNEVINDFSMINLKEQIQKVEKEIKKIHEQNEHHGLLGWIEDLFKSIVHVFKAVFNMTEDLVTGHFSDFGKSLEKLLGVDQLVDAFKEIFEGKVIKGLEDFLTTFITAAIISPLLVNTKFGDDVENGVKLVLDTVLASVKSIYDLMSDDVSGAGKDWEKVIRNPALQAVLQLAMVSIIATSALSGQYYLAAFMATLMILSATGVLTALTKDIASAIGDGADGKFIADMIVISIVTLSSLGVGSLATLGESAVEEVAQEADIATENEALLSALKRKLGEGFESFAKGVGTPGGSALMGLGASLGSTSVGYDFVEAFLKKDKKHIEEILMIVQEVVAGLLSAVGGIGMTVGASVSSVGNVVADQTKKFLPSLMKWFEENNGAISDFAAQMQQGAFAIGGIAQLENGGVSIYKGKLQEQLEEFLANIKVLNVTASETQKAMKSLMQAYKRLSNEMSNVNNEAYQAVGAGIEGEIRALMGQV